MAQTASDLGYKIGQKFIADGSAIVTKGSVVEFVEDDGTHAPYFKIVKGAAVGGTFSDGRVALNWSRLKPAKTKLKKKKLEGYMQIKTLPVGTKLWIEGVKVKISYHYSGSNDYGIEVSVKDVEAGRELAQRANVHQYSTSNLLVPDLYVRENFRKIKYREKPKD